MRRNSECAVQKQYRLLCRVVHNRGGKKEMYDHVIISKEKNRGQMQLEATWKPVLYFGENAPWTNIQGVYSNFWWNYTIKTPFLFPFPATRDFDVLLKKQTDEIGYFDIITKYNVRDRIKGIFPDCGYNRLSVETAGDKLAQKNLRITQIGLSAYVNISMTREISTLDACGIVKI